LPSYSSPRPPSLSMAVVTAAVVVAVAHAPAAVEVSTEAVAPLADPAAAIMAAAIMAVRPALAVGDRPRGRALVPVRQAVQVPDIRGLGKAAVPATHLPDGISFHPAAPGR
jgi:hypothetical protein